ncbi:MAG: 50S ribosomal protein L9 [Porticoccaceae bacterium]|jgi:large subunit ribosomal protein L9|nr:50S ribosomal protein L9 [Porticoccaceae bacterium]
MEVILLEKIGRLGNIGDRVRVRAGYGRNYLIPQGKAVFATQENVARFEARRAELEQLAAARLGEAQALADQIAQIGSLTLSAVAGEGGKLFGSVSARDIADALAAAGIEVPRTAIRLPAGAIRELGEFDVEVQLHSDLLQEIRVQIVEQH